MRTGLWLLATFVVSLVVFSSPITSAQIDFSNPNYEVLFKNNLRRGFLNLAGKKIGDKGLLILLQQDFLGDLKKLDLRYNEISALGAKQLASSTSFKNLKTLILKHNFLSDEGSIALAKSSGFTRIKEMQLGWNEIRDAGALAFVESKNFPNLEKLDLRGNFLAGKTKEALRSSLSHLKSLRIFQSE